MHCPLGSLVNRVLGDEFNYRVQSVYRYFFNRSFQDFLVGSGSTHHARVRLRCLVLMFLGYSRMEVLPPDGVFVFARVHVIVGSDMLFLGGEDIHDGERFHVGLYRREHNIERLRDTFAIPNASDGIVFVNGHNISERSNELLAAIFLTVKVPA